MHTFNTNSLRNRFRDAMQEGIDGIPLPTIGEKLQSLKNDKQSAADFIAKSNPELVCAAPDLLSALRWFADELPSIIFAPIAPKACRCQLQRLTMKQGPQSQKRRA